MHLLVAFPANTAVSKLVSSLKDVSSRRLLRQEFPDLLRQCRRAQRLRSGSVGGAPPSILRQHIKHQNRPV